MNYSTLFSDFVLLFPDDKAKIESIASSAFIDSSDGMHVVFGLVVMPFVKQVIESGNTKKTKDVFEFFESMTLSCDENIVNILEVTVAEDIVSNGKAYISKCLPFMGENTKSACKKVMEYYSVPD